MIAKLSKISIWCICLLASCNMNGVYENRIEDKKEAEKVTATFYHFIRNKQLPKTYPLFTKRYFSATDTAMFIAINQQIMDQCGAIISYRLIDWKTTVVKGTNASSEYIFQYEVSRSRRTTKETLGLKKEDGNIKIAVYNVTVY